MLLLKILILTILILAASVPVYVSAAYIDFYYVSFKLDYVIFSAIIAVLTMLSALVANSFFTKKENDDFKVSQVSIHDDLSPETKQKSRKIPIGALILLAASICTALFFQLVIKGGQLITPFTIISLILLWFVVVPPVRLVNKGIGEILFGGILVFLALILSGYSNSGTLDFDLLILGAPLSFSLISVFLSLSIVNFNFEGLNFYSGFAGRFGIRAAGVFYMIILVLFISSFLIMKLMGLFLGAWYQAPTIAAIALIIPVTFGFYQSKKTSIILFLLTCLHFLFTNYVFIRTYLIVTE